MKNIARCLALIFGLAVAVACDDTVGNCEGNACDAWGGTGGVGEAGAGGVDPGDGGTGAGGSGGTGGDGGTGGSDDPGHGGSGAAGGDGGTGGTGGQPNTSWAEMPAEKCTDPEASKAINSGLFQEVFLVGAQPRLEVGFSSGATVEGYEENETVVNLKTDASKSVRIKWAGVLGPFMFAVGSKITLEQTRDWTILRNDKTLAAMFRLQGALPDEFLEPIPFGGPSLRFATQCSLQNDAHCKSDVVELRSGDGETLQRYPTGEHVIGDNWRVDNRTMLQSSNCPGAVPIRSMIAVEGRPSGNR